MRDLDFADDRDEMDDDDRRIGRDDPICTQCGDRYARVVKFGMCAPCAEVTITAREEHRRTA